MRGNSQVWSYLKQYEGSSFPECGPRLTDMFALLHSSLRILQISSGHHPLETGAVGLLWISHP